MKTMDRLRQIPLLSALILHVGLFFIRGYVLYTEFTLYPYLVSRGFVPYRDILDQHLPTLFFGPFSLPTFLTTNPWPLLGTFLTVLCLTDIVLYASLIRYKIKNPVTWLILYIVTSIYFSGSVLWIETFVNLLLSLWLFLSFSKKNLHRFTAGFLLSQILLLRPTIAPALLMLIFSLSGFSWPLFFGGAIGIAIPTFYIVKQEIIADFYRLVIQFNRNVYPVEARIFPDLRQIITLSGWFMPIAYSIIKNKKYQYFITSIFFIILIYPRFGFEHLQPFFLISILFWSKISRKPNYLVFIYIIIISFLIVVSSISHPYDIYNLSSEDRKVAGVLKEMPGREIYLLGAPDNFYQLSDKIPPNYTYLPSLSWYFHQKDFRDKVITSLKISRSPVLINSRVVNESGSIFEYIKMNYSEEGMIGVFQLYLPKK